MLVNPANAENNVIVRQKLLSLVPNSTEEFENYFVEHEEVARCGTHATSEQFAGEEQAILLFPDYFDKYFPQFGHQNDER